MTVPHERLREWIISKLDQKNVYGLEWKDKNEMTFKVIWLHQRNSEWRDEYGQVFLEWAQHTGKYVPGRDEKNYTQWKTTLRNALHKCEEFKELHKSPAKCKPYPFKIYQILERKKKTPIRQSPGPEQERFEPVSDNSQHLPVVVDEMASLESPTLASPTQRVPGTVEGVAMSDILNPLINNTMSEGNNITSEGHCVSNSSTGSSLGQIDPSQEIALTSSEFQNLLDQVEATYPSTTPNLPLLSSASIPLTSPTQPVPHSIERAAMSNISNLGQSNTTSEGLCGSESATGSPMGQVDPSQESVLTSSELQNLLDQVQAIDASTLRATLPSASMPGAKGDVLQQAVADTILSEHETQIFSAASGDQELAAYLTSNSQIITDPHLGQQEMNVDMLIKDPSLSMEISFGSDIANFDPVKTVASDPVKTVASTDQPHLTKANSQSVTTSVWQDCSFQYAMPSVSGSQVRAPIPNSKDAADDTGKPTCNEETLSDLFAEATNGGLNATDIVGIDHSLKKYSYPTIPDHSCDNSCNLFLELLYQGHLVKEWSILNPSGCRVHSQVNPITVHLGKAKNIDIEAVYGAENKDRCELLPWPAEIKIKSPEKVQTLLQGLRRGLLIDSQEGNIYVTRLCKIELYYSPAFVTGDPTQQPVEITRTKVSNVHQHIKVFDYENSFLPALSKYRERGEQGCPKPSTGVYIHIGQKSMDRRKLLVAVRVTSCKALRELYQTEHGKEEDSLSLRMEAPDSFDKIDSLLQKISNTLTLKEK